MPRKRSSVVFSDFHPKRQKSDRPTDHAKSISQYIQRTKVRNPSTTTLRQGKAPTAFHGRKDGPAKLKQASDAIIPQSLKACQIRRDAPRKTPYSAHGDTPDSHILVPDSDDEGTSDPLLRLRGGGEEPVSAGAQTVKSPSATKRPASRRPSISSKSTIAQSRPLQIATGPKTPKTFPETPEKSPDRRKRSSASNPSETAVLKSQHRSRSRSVSRSLSARTRGNENRPADPSVLQLQDLGSEREQEKSSKSKGKGKSEHGPADITAVTSRTEHQSLGENDLHDQAELKETPNRKDKGKARAKSPETPKDTLAWVTTYPQDHLPQTPGAGPSRPPSRQGDRAQSPPRGLSEDASPTQSGPVFQTINRALIAASQGTENLTVPVHPEQSRAPAPLHDIDPALLRPGTAVELERASQQHLDHYRQLQGQVRRRRSRPIQRSKSRSRSQHGSASGEHREFQQPLFAPQDSSSGVQDVTEGVLARGGITQSNTSNDVSNPRSAARSRISGSRGDTTRDEQTESSRSRHRHSNSSRSASRGENPFQIVAGLRFKYQRVVMPVLAEYDAGTQKRAIAEYHCRINVQRLLILMMLAHRQSESHLRDTPKDQRDFFDSDKYFSLAWKTLYRDVNEVFRRYGGGSWDKDWRTYVKRMPELTEFDPISQKNGCDLCGRTLEYAVFYGSVTISGPSYDESTLTTVNRNQEPESVTINMGTNCFKDFTEAHRIRHLAYYDYKIYYEDHFKPVFQDRKFREYRDRNGYVNMSMVIHAVKQADKRAYEALVSDVYKRLTLVNKRRFERGRYVRPVFNKYRSAWGL